MLERVREAALTHCFGGVKSHTPIMEIRMEDSQKKKKKIEIEPLWKDSTDHSKGFVGTMVGMLPPSLLGTSTHIPGKCNVPL